MENHKRKTSLKEARCHHIVRMALFKGNYLKFDSSDHFFAVQWVTVDAVFCLCLRAQCLIFQNSTFQQQHNWGWCLEFCWRIFTSLKKIPLQCMSACRQIMEGCFCVGFSLIKDSSQITQWSSRTAYKEGKGQYQMTCHDIKTSVCISVVRF